MFTTKQKLTNDKFSQQSGDILTISGSTTILNLTGSSTTYLKTLKGSPDLKIQTNNLSFSEDLTSLQSGSYDPTFVSGGGFNSTPVFVREFGGKLLFAGSLVTFNNLQNVNDVIILNNDQSKDTSFTTGDFNNSVLTVIQDGSKYLCTGAFSSFSGVSTSRIVRLNSNGTRDNTFTIGAGFSQSVQETIVQSDGKYVAVGSFTSYDGTTRNRIARINSGGTIDTSYNLGTGFNGTPTDIVLQADQKVVVAGSFTTFSGVTTNRIVRINTNGTRDNTFNIGTGFDGTVSDLAIQTDQKIIAVGSFTSYSGITSNRIIRLNTNGTRDNTFNIGTGFDNSALVALVDTNGKILIGGSFTTYSGQTVNLVVRLNTNGTLDTSFTFPSIFPAGGAITYITQRSNGNYVIVGTGILGSVSTGNKRRYVVEVTSTGSITSSFVIKNTGFFGGNVNTIKPLSSNKILIGGAFNSFDDQTNSGKLIRLNSDDTFDNTFTNGQLNGDVNVIKLISGETKMMVGGTFTAYGATTNKNRLIRLNADGTLDSTFNIGTSGFNSGVMSLNVLSNGKMYVGGQFTSFSGQTAPFIIKINANGSKDTSFNLSQIINVYQGGSTTDSSFSGTISNIHVQPSGKIILTGSFDFYSEVDIYSPYYYNNTALRITTGGTIDLTWGYKPEMVVDASSGIVSLMQSDGKVILGGDFTDLNGSSSGMTIGRIMRLTVDGLIDTTFNTGSGFNSTVTSLSFDTDGSILVGGLFTTYKGVSCNGLAKIDTNGVLQPSLNVGVGFSGGYVIDIVKINTKYLAGGSFLYYQNNLAAALVSIAAGGSGYTINVSTGLKYTSDITSNLTDLTLTHKKYVFDLVASKINTFNNGLTITGTSVSLGGLLNKNTTIAASTFNWTLSGTTSNILLKNKTISLGGSTSNGIERTKLILTPTGATFYDTTTGGTRGLKYGGNYISGLTNTSLVPKQYIINLFSGSNGLKLTTGNTLDLGGSIIKDTVLSGITKSFKIIHNDFESSTNVDSNIKHISKIATLDSNYIENEGFDIAPNKVVELFNGKILVAGSFRIYNGQVIPKGFARLNSDGTLDTTFNVGGVGFTNSLIPYALVVQPDGKILIAGDFFGYNGLNVQNLIRLNSDGTRDTSFSIPLNFSLWFNSTVYGLALQPDNKIIVVGNFTQYSGQTHNYIIRLNANGFIDTTFVNGSGFNNFTEAVAVQSDGKILVGGAFTSYSGVTKNKITRLNSNGSIDGTFNIGSGFTNQVTNFAIQANNKILVGGLLFQYNGLNNIGNIIRLNTNGTIDNTFLTGNTSTISGGNQVTKIIVLPNQKILLAGTFTQYGATTNKNGLVRLNTGGTIDNTFTINGGFKGKLGSGSNLVDDIYYNTGTTKIFVVGGFTSHNDQTPKKFIARVDGTGSLDNVFNISKISFNNSIEKIEKYDDQRFMVSGSFTHKNGKLQYSLARVFNDNSLDQTFHNGYTQLVGVRCFKILSDGKMLISDSSGSYSGASTSTFFKIDSNGFVDPTFKKPTGGSNNIEAIDIQTDNKIIVGGTFTTYSGTSKNRIARLNSNGIIDNTFVIGSGFNNTVTSICVQSDGKILVGGSFTSYSGVTRNGMARLNSNGSLDSSFNVTGSGFDGDPATLVVQSDGKILVGGNFSQYNGAIYRALVRLNSNGTIDPTFIKSNSFFANNVKKIILDKYNRVIIAGSFTSLSGYTSSTLMRLFIDGGIDYSFNANNGFSSTLYPGGFGDGAAYDSFLTDSSIFVGGSLLTYKNNSVVYNLAKIDIFSDIIVDNSTAMKYNNDYSLSYTSRSIPDVRFVTGLTSTLASKTFLTTNFVSGATNGLSKTGNNVGLGGTLSATTTIILPNSSTTDFEIRANAVNRGRIAIGTGANGAQTYAEIIANNTLNRSALYLDNLNIGSGGFGPGNWFDDALGVGLQYTGNFSAGYTSRSLIDNGYITGSTYTQLKPITIIGTTTTLTATHFTVLVNANVTINLPAVASNVGRIYNIKMISPATSVTIDPNASEQIDGASTLVISTLNQTKQIQSNGTAWFVIN
jgi:uncharacterized delta-60 repeat protein